MIYTALIGFFAIEELNGRNETLRALLLEQARLAVEVLCDGESHIKEIKALSGLQQSIAALVVSNLCFGGADAGKLRSKWNTGNILR